MPVNILMPALSPTMTEGNLAKWHVKPGDTVSSGDVVAEIETDKATMEVEAVDEGTVGKLLVAEGTEGVPVNQPIAVLLEEGESEADLDAAPAPPAPAGDSGGDAQPAAQSGSGAASSGGSPPRRPRRRARHAGQPGERAAGPARAQGRLRQPGVRFAAGPADGQAGGHRSGQSQGHGAARADRARRRRTGDRARNAGVPAGGRAAGRTAGGPGRRRSPTSRPRRSSRPPRRAWTPRPPPISSAWPTRKSRSTTCARRSPSA